MEKIKRIDKSIPWGIIITETLHGCGLPAFEDIKDEINNAVNSAIGPC
jgi:hypothetical protein